MVFSVTVSFENIQGIMHPSHHPFLPNPRPLNVGLKPSEKYSLQQLFVLLQNSNKPSLNSFKN
jgi:hypothetical protein